MSPEIPDIPIKIPTVTRPGRVPIRQDIVAILQTPVIFKGNKMVRADTKSDTIMATKKMILTGRIINAKPAITAITPKIFTAFRVAWHP